MDDIIKGSANTALKSGIDDFNSLIETMESIKSIVEEDDILSQYSVDNFVVCLGNNNWTDLTKCPLRQLERYREKTKELLVEAMVTEIESDKLVNAKRHSEAIEALYTKRVESEGHSR
jgi:GGDEF domain-containing protein